LRVDAAIAARVVHPSKWVPSPSPVRGKKWSQTHRLSTPRSSIAVQASRSAAMVVCWGQSWTPTLNRAMRSPDGDGERRPVCRRVPRSCPAREAAELLGCGALGDDDLDPRAVVDEHLLDD